MFEPCPGCCRGGYGVIDMALLSVIRRWHFREYLSIREMVAGPACPLSATQLSRLTYGQPSHTTTTWTTPSLPTNQSLIFPIQSSGVMA
jgi:hypothetical protein